MSELHSWPIRGECKGFRLTEVDDEIIAIARKVATEAALAPQPTEPTFAYRLGQFESAITEGILRALEAKERSC